MLSMSSGTRRSSKRISPESGRRMPPRQRGHEAAPFPRILSDDRDRRLHAIVFDADHERGVPLLQEAAGGRQLRHAVAGVGQGLDGLLGILTLDDGDDQLDARTSLSAKRLLTLPSTFAWISSGAPRASTRRNRSGSAAANRSYAAATAR